MTGRMPSKPSVPQGLPHFQRFDHPASSAPRAPASHARSRRYRRVRLTRRTLGVSPRRRRRVRRTAVAGRSGPQVVRWRDTSVATFGMETPGQRIVEVPGALPRRVAIQNRGRAACSDGSRSTAPAKRAQSFAATSWSASKRAPRLLTQPTEQQSMVFAGSGKASASGVDRETGRSATTPTSRGLSQRRQIPDTRHIIRHGNRTDLIGAEQETVAVSEVESQRAWTSTPAASDGDHVDCRRRPRENASQEHSTVTGLARRSPRQSPDAAGEHRQPRQGGSECANALLALRATVRRETEHR